MLENVGRKITLILLLLGVSAGLVWLPERPFKLGLDLEGGTRLVYSFDFDEAAQQGEISRNEDRDLLLQQTIAIIRNRVDPTGTLDAVIRQEGKTRIVVELPGTLGLGDAVTGALSAPIDNGVDELTLEGASASAFPAGGGVVQLGAEKVRYARRDGDRLAGLTRGHYGTIPQAHAAGVAVELISDDGIRSKIENLGELSFMIVASPSDAMDGKLGDTDLTIERQKLTDWVGAHPNAPLVDFNKVPAAQGGPTPQIAWYPHKPQKDERTGQEDLRTDLERAMPLLRSAPGSDDEFRGSDIERVFPTQDRVGYPAVGFDMRGPRKGEFGDFTEENENRLMAIVLNDVIESAPVINGRLPGSGIIQGQYTDTEMADLITVLRSGSLKLRPTLESEESVGPTLGADYIERGFLSGIVALILVLVFMVGYYRLLGIFAALALGAAFMMLMGGLAFLNATLTLPGIAGIILTVGMAVDANILIFDRIREEMDKGRNVKQASKTGFEKALSAILDANITTFLTAIILFQVGTGPVRGFAVTLMIGIVTSVFAALAITRVLVHFALVRNAKPFRVGTWMVTANYEFLSKAKFAIAVSAVAILAGLGLFFATASEDKLGIDFLGGAEAVVRTEQPQSTDTMRTAVAAIPGDIGESAEVKPVLSSEVGDGRYQEFRTTVKAHGDDDSQVEQTFKRELESGLAALLLQDPIRVDLAGEGATARVDLHLIFEETHPTEDLAARLQAAGLDQVTVTVSPDRSNAFNAAGTTSAGQTPDAVRASIERALRNQVDSNGARYNTAQPIPSVTVVGPQVVGELRDKALLALAISLFVIVLYIRVRFAEYSYGFAAVAAVLHDVLVTLGVLTLANRLGIINGEISLPMIAAFLTIIGYSLNDTIVIFDRVRENLPRSKTSLGEVLDTSVNQTLSRTILTSLTTFMAVAVMFAFNFGTGNVLESFSFAMMIGIVTGTYSTIFIANPVLLWLESRAGRVGGRAAAKTEAKPEAT